MEGEAHGVIVPAVGDVVAGEGEFAHVEGVVGVEEEHGVVSGERQGAHAEAGGDVGGGLVAAVAHELGNLVEVAAFKIGTGNGPAHNGDAGFVDGPAAVELVAAHSLGVAGLMGLRYGTARKGKAHAAVLAVVKLRGAKALEGVPAAAHGKSSGAVFHALIGRCLSQDIEAALGEFDAHDAARRHGLGACI